MHRTRIHNKQEKVHAKELASSLTASSYPHFTHQRPDQNGKHLNLDVRILIIRKILQVVGSLAIDDHFLVPVDPDKLL